MSTMSLNNNVSLDSFDPFEPKDKKTLPLKQPIEDEFDPFRIYSSPMAKRKNALAHRPVASKNQLVNFNQNNTPQQIFPPKEDYTSDSDNWKNQSIEELNEPFTPDLPLQDFDTSSLSSRSKGKSIVNPFLRSSSDLLSPISEESTEEEEEEKKQKKPKKKSKLKRRKTKEDVYKHSLSSDEEDDDLDSDKGVLKVTIIEGSDYMIDCKEESLMQKPSTVVKLQMSSGRKDLRTFEFPKSSNPKYNEDFLFQVHNKKLETMYFTLKESSSLLSNQKLGFATFSIAKLKPYRNEERWLPLEGMVGQLHVSFKWKPEQVIDPVDGIKEPSCCKIPRLRIECDTLEFKPGDSIQGKIKLTVGKPMKIKKGLDIKFRGKEAIDISQDGREVFGEKLIVNKNHTILTPRILEPGRYSWKFTIQLQKENLPPSFADYFGFIRYLLFTQIDDGKKHFYSVPVKIVTPFPEKLPPRDLKNRLSVSNEAKNISIKASTKSWLYFLGVDTKMYLKVEVDNLSSHNVGKVKIKFVEIKSGQGAGGKTPFKERTVIAERILKGVCPKGFGHFEKEFTVTFPTGYDQQTITPEHGSDMIQIRHAVIITVIKDAIAHKHRQKLELPITFAVRDKLNKPPKKKKKSKSKKKNNKKKKKDNPLRRSRSF